VGALSERDPALVALLAALPEHERRRDAERLIALLLEIAGEPVVLLNNTIGFGSGDAEQPYRIGLSPRRREFVFHLPHALGLHSALLAKLGRFKADDKRLYIKRLSDVDAKVLLELLAASSRSAHPD